MTCLKSFAKAWQAKTSVVPYDNHFHANIVQNFISDNCVLAAGKYLLSETRSNDFETIKPLFESLANLIQPGNPVDTRRLALVVVRTTCRHHMELVRRHLPLLAPPVFASVRDPVIPVKLAAEAAFMA